MKIINELIQIEMTREETRVITKMIGPTSFDSRKKDFKLSDRESNIAELLYNDLAIIGEEDE